MQARGQRSQDGTELTADEIVTGSFSNFSGTLTAVDATAGTVTLKDLASKKTVTVALSGQTNLRRLPAGFAQGASAAGGSAETAGADRPSGAGAGQAAGATGASARGTGRTGGSHLDLSRVMNRLPTETVSELKPGEAVMIVAANDPNAGNPTAITLLSGVEQILASSPAGQTTLSPWSLGGEGEAGEAGSGGSGGGR